MPSIGVVLGVLTAIAGCQAGTPAPAPPPASIGTRLDGPVPATILQLPLIDSTGRQVSLASFHSRIIVINDLTTLCQETCPLDTANLVAAARAVDRAGLGDRIEFLSITVDPRRDSPAQLAAYRQLYSPAPPDWAAVTGSAADLSTLWKYLGVYYKQVPEDNPSATNWRTGEKLTYDVNHADELFFLDPTGHERFIMDGPGHVEADSALPAPMYSFLNDEGHQKLDHPEGDAWTVAQALRVLSWLAHHDISGSRPE
jgi:cytochrome oxidase Cu insertion factor (SCO1/SenC/PrrC family)